MFLFLLTVACTGSSRTGVIEPQVFKVFASSLYPSIVAGVMYLTASVKQKKNLPHHKHFKIPLNHIIVEQNTLQLVICDATCQNQALLAI